MNKFFSFLKEKLISINDSPHKIALGFGLGVFAGIFPGTGPIAAIFLAVIFRANRAAALAASLATNTWLSFLIFAVSLQAGAAVLGTDWHSAYETSRALLENFSWRTLFSGPVLTVVKPMLVGYLLVGLALGAGSYLLVYGILKLRKQ
jgi:uncharacterized protein